MKKAAALYLLCLALLGVAEAFHVARTTLRQPRHLLSTSSSVSSKPFERKRRTNDGLRTAAVDDMDQLPGTIQDIFDSYQSRNSSLPTTSTLSSSLSPQYPTTPTLRECLAFALPALGIYICPPLMSLIDASFIGRSSSVELAALGPASSISDSAPLPLLFLSIAATNLIAKSFAQKDHAASARVSRTAIGMGSMCGLVLATLLYTWANPISVLYCGGEAAAAAQLLAPACAKYVAIRALALPFVVVTTIAQAICIGTKDTRTPMISVALAGVCNLLGDFILCKWLGKGIAGAAWATSVSQVLAAGLLLRVLKKRGFLQKEQQHDIAKMASNPSTFEANNNNNKNNTSTMATVKQLLSFIPFLFIMTVKIGWHNSCTATAASLGGVQAAAHTALLSVAMVCMVLGDVGSSLSQAFLPAFEGSTTTSTPKIKGGKAIQSESTKPTFDMEAAMPTIKQLLKCTISISASVTAFAAVMIGIFGGQISSDPSVLAEMRKTLPWILTALSFHGSAVTLEGLLLSRKKFRALSVCYTVLAVTVAAFQIATRSFGLGLAGVWACYVWFCASRVIAFSSLGGLLRPRRWLQRIREGRKLQVKAQTV